ncbi:Ser/Thr and Tyr protein phosphatase (dual specificity) [Shigella dysenteriae 1617]|uniref:Ser/Thr and Tyr protein phosphatase (Dual specificity) n=1 Tax=Shigella dysenteriae 1617 TaxID=754093 RepID=A0A0A6ZTE1_SHIDY|nr:Ser/Thr and Tyr protein phosphatase (dual specificity) [Shigella dysenteriae 1617]
MGNGDPFSSLDYCSLLESGSFIWPFAFNARLTGLISVSELKNN